MKKGDKLVVVEVENLGQIIAPAKVLNSISIAFSEAAKYELAEYPDLSGSSELYEGYSKEIYDQLEELGLYEDL